MLSDLAGGQDMAYIEFNRSRNKDLRNRKEMKGSAFLRKVKNDQARRKARANDL